MKMIVTEQSDSYTRNELKKKEKEKKKEIQRQRASEIVETGVQRESRWRVLNTNSSL